MYMYIFLSPFVPPYTKKHIPCLIKRYIYYYYYYGNSIEE